MQTIVASIVTSVILVALPAVPGAHSAAPDSIGTPICRAIPILCR